jgi:surfeit locus 1 family protein
VNDATTYRQRSPLPFIVGGGFVVLFITAGFWQLDRRGEKLDLETAFANATGYTSYASGNGIRPFERLEVRGRYLGERQIILDNMIVDGRVGHFILTPLETGGDEPLVIVNRGFVPMSDAGIRQADIDVERASREVRGRVGRLPRPGYRMGAAIPEVTSWPVHAVYPVYEDLEITLGREVQPFVLLLDADEPDGWTRAWQPDGVGPGRHLAYAVQWFAMALVLSGLLVMHARKRSFDND